MVLMVLERTFRRSRVIDVVPTVKATRDRRPQESATDHADE